MRGRSCVLVEPPFQREGEANQGPDEDWGEQTQISPLAPLANFHSLYSHLSSVTPLHPKEENWVTERMPRPLMTWASFKWVTCGSWESPSARRPLSSSAPRVGPPGRGQSPSPGRLQNCQNSRRGAWCIYSNHPPTCFTGFGAQKERKGKSEHAPISRAAPQKHRFPVLTRP
jgi:hypothetical protein